MQEADPDSMLNHIRRVLEVRKENPDLGNYSSFTVFHARENDRLFAFKRGSMLVAVNPSGEETTLELDGAYEPVFTFGEAEVKDHVLTLGAQTLTVLK